MSNNLDIITKRINVNSDLDIHELIDDVIPSISIFAYDLHIHISHNIYNNRTYLAILKKNETVFEKAIGKKMIGVDEA
jgi:hypothetical protein